MFYVSNEASNGFILGNDSNDGLTKSTPWLTANYALDQFKDSGNDGETITFNDGDYEYTNGDGRYILSHALCEIAFANDYATRIIFSGSNSQGLRYNTSDSEAKNFTFGRGIIATSGAKLSQVIWSGNSASSQLLTVNWYGRIEVDPLQAGATGMDLAASNLSLTVFDGGSYGVTDKTYRPIKQNSGITIVAVSVDIRAWTFSLECEMVGSEGAIDIDFNSGNSSGAVSVKGLTGRIVDVDSANDVSYCARLENCPDNSSIEDCKDLTLVSSGVKSLSGFGIQAPIASGVTCDAPSIKNNIGIVVTSVGGFLAVIGGEGSDHDTTNGVISGNKFRVTNISAGSTVHGICHIGCTGGIRENNIVDGASIGSLTKRGAAISRNNWYKNIGGSSSVYLYGKGAESGTSFEGERCYIPNGFTGRVEQALEDTTGSPNQDSVNVSFSDTRVIRDDVSLLSSAHSVVYIGTGTDASTGTSSGMMIDSPLGIPTNVSSVSGVNYSSISASNAISSIKGMRQIALSSLSPQVLMQPSRENVLYPSASYGAPWALTNITASADVTVAGFPSSETLIPSALSAAHYIKLDTSVVSGTRYVQSHVVKPDGYNWVQITGGTGFATTYVNYELIGNGSIGNNTAGTQSHGIEYLSKGAYLIWYEDSATSSVSGGFEVSVMDSDYASRNPSFSGDAASGVMFAHSQMEVGTRYSSPIKTVSSSATRDPDLIQTTELDNWFPESEGVLIAALSESGDWAEIGTCYYLYGGTSGSTFIYRLTGDDGLRAFDGTSGVIAASGHTPGGEVLVSVIWSASLNKLVIGYTPDAGVTWHWDNSPASFSGFSPGTTMKLGNTIKESYKNRAVLVYDDLHPNNKESLADIKAWVESNALSEVELENNPHMLYATELERSGMRAATLKNILL